MGQFTIKGGAKMTKFFCWGFYLLMILPLHPYQAYCILPVTDVLSMVVQGATLKEIQEKYRAIPYSLNDTTSEPSRLHQIIFNETVEVLKEEVGLYQSYVRIVNCFYLNKNKQKASLEGWVGNWALLPKDKVQPAVAQSFPSAINFKEPKYQSDNVVVLLDSWGDLTGNSLFSAGTRFMRLPKYDTTTHYAVLKYQNPAQVVTLFIPRCIARIEEVSCPSQQKEIFLSLLHKWSKKRDPIAYVWGGMSFIEELPDFSMPFSHVGFDCSGLILRAAQCASMPYFFKNSMTIKNSLTALGQSALIKPGDIIWHKGHVMIVADLLNNELIEAKGYQSGFGKVQKIKLSERFENIATWQQFVTKMQTAFPLISLSVNKKRELYTDYTILSLDSLYRS